MMDLLSLSYRHMPDYHFEEFNMAAGAAGWSFQQPF
jgi:hypothetical protein